MSIFQLLYFDWVNSQVFQMFCQKVVTTIWNSYGNSLTFKCLNIEMHIVQVAQRYLPQPTGIPVWPAGSRQQNLCASCVECEKDSLIVWSERMRLRLSLRWKESGVNCFNFAGKQQFSCKSGDNSNDCRGVSSDSKCMPRRSGIFIYNFFFLLTFVCFFFYFLTVARLMLQKVYAQMLTLKRNIYMWTTYTKTIWFNFTNSHTHSGYPGLPGSHANHFPFAPAHGPRPNVVIVVRITSFFLFFKMNQ